MANALFLDYSISVSDSGRDPLLAAPRPTTVSVVSDATGLDRDKLRKFFDGLIRLSETDLRTVEAIISHLADVESNEAGQTVQELLDGDNDRLRDRFVAELSPMRREDVLRLVQRSGQDGEMVLQGWESERRVFSVTHHGKTYYPDFQFRDDRPAPIIKDVLDALPQELSDWQRAFWFVSANGWTRDEAPADHLDDPALVLQAARFEGEPVVG